MNELEKKLITDHAHLEWDELPAAVREQIDASPACRRAWDQAQAVRQLMALKRHETPAGEVPGRIQYKIRTRLENLDQEPIRESTGLAGWTWIKFALGVMVVALISINLLIQIEKSRQHGGAGDPGAGSLIAQPEPPPFKAIPTQTNTLPVARPTPVDTSGNQGGIKFIDN